MKYDYLIVGSGLFGSVFAFEMNKVGKKCLVIEKRPHLGGNVFCEKIDEIITHKYGPHIFHTNDENIWKYVNQFVDFNRFTYMPIANYKGEMYNLPFNMNTFYKFWGISDPNDIKAKINKEVCSLNIKIPKNLEEQAISLVGVSIYEKLIKGYTEKQWGRKASELPSFIIKRLPLRFIFDNNYFDDKFQGIPIGGYNKIIEKLLKNIEVRKNVDFFKNKEYFKSISKKILYTGPLDEFFDFKFGPLEYRSLTFESSRKNVNNYQGNAVINYTDNLTKYTRIIEHKHFEFGDNLNHTIITKEYPDKWNFGKEPYYPINDSINNNNFMKYKSISNTNSNILFGGRLAEYKYYDMHQIIGSALKKSKDSL